MSGYRLRARALSDLREIALYTQGRWGAKQRDKYLDALFDCFGGLARNPMLGVARSDIATGLRSMGCGRHVVVYQPVAGGVQIIRVLHGSMDVHRHIPGDES